MSLYEIIAYALALVIGLVMGMLGSGGSILSVPVFVYLLSYTTLPATTYSLFVVGVTSAIGTIPYFKKNLIQLNHIVYFGAASMLSVMSIRLFILPNLPDTLYSGRFFSIEKDTFILILFSVLMSFSAIKMIRKNNAPKQAAKSPNKELLIIQGIGVGTLTGFIGAGGGFLIVPALVLILGLDMKRAIGTSLCIVALNSLIGFISSAPHVDIDWGVLLTFTAISVAGIEIGLYFSNRTDSSRLKPLFGWFLLIVGMYIILKETLLA